MSIYLKEIRDIRVDGRPDKATLNDYFHLATCSKTVLALMVARLVKQQKISWQTKFFDVFPELAASARSEYLGSTLDDLFLCRAGIKAYMDARVDPFPNYPASVTDQEMEFIRRLVTIPSSSEKKSRCFEHLYSNASYSMIAAIRHRVSGMTYDAMVKKTLTDDSGLSVSIGFPNRLHARQPWGGLLERGRA
jgi:D-alanyl-D-alanine carboxypeptidase